MTFAADWQIAILPPLVFLAVALLGVIFLCFKQKQLGWSLIAGGLVLLVTFGPLLFHQRVEVTDHSIHQTIGFWFWPISNGFEFDAVDHVYVEEGYRNDLRADTWHIHYKDGSVQSLDPGDLWADNWDIIIPHLRAHGVTVHASWEPALTNEMDLDK